MGIKDRIKFIRIQKRLKQSDIADKLGIERPNYNRFESRGDKLTIEQLKKIATALGVTIRELLFDENSTDSERELEGLRREIEFLKRENQLLEKEMELMKKEMELFRLKYDAK